MSRVMMAGPQGGSPSASQGSALVHYPISSSVTSSPQAPSAPVPAAVLSAVRLEEQDVFERPPPKNAELFNPKAAGRAGGINGASNGKPENGRSRANTGGSIVATGLAEKMGAMALVDVATGGGELPAAALAALDAVQVPAMAGEAAAASS